MESWWVVANVITAAQTNREPGCLWVFARTDTMESAFAVGQLFELTSDSRCCERSEFFVKLLGRQKEGAHNFNEGRSFFRSASHALCRKWNLHATSLLFSLAARRTNKSRDAEKRLFGTVLNLSAGVFYVSSSWRVNYWFLIHANKWIIKFIKKI